MGPKAGVKRGEITNGNHHQGRRVTAHSIFACRSLFLLLSILPRYPRWNRTRTLLSCTCHPQTRSVVKKKNPQALFFFFLPVRDIGSHPTHQEGRCVYVKYPSFFFFLFWTLRVASDRYTIRDHLIIRQFLLRGRMR